MANYNFKENPTYQTQIRAWSNSDPANAETVLNPVVETVINNTHAVKLSADQHKNDSDKHITAAERKKLGTIEEGANKYVHPNSGAAAGTYRSVTVNAGGHVTTGSNPTTISGYGLTDAYTKTEVDTKINTHTGSTSSHVSTTDRTNWNDAGSKKHEHSNKAVLDGITSTKISNWDSASTNNHTHSNKTVLDGVTSAKVTNWDSASTNSHTHSNKTVLDGMTSAKVTNWDNASTNNHTHSNKTVLDGISSAKVTSWDSASANNHTHSNKTVLDSVSQTKVTTWDGYGQKITDYTEDTGFIEFSNRLTNGFSLYDDGTELIKLNRALRVRRIGKLVIISGIVTPPANAAINSANNLTFATLPDKKFYPSNYQYSLSQGSSTAIWFFSVTADGLLRAGKYQQNGSYISPPSGAWMSFNLQYFVT